MRDIQLKVPAELHRGPKERQNVLKDCISKSTSTKDHPYLHSIAEVSSSSDSHHGQQARSSPNVQDDDLLTSSLYSGYSCPDALIVLLILETERKS